MIELWYWWLRRWQQFRNRGYVAQGDLRDRRLASWAETQLHTHRHIVCGAITASSQGDRGHTHSCSCEQQIPIDHHGFPWDWFAHHGTVRR